MYVDGKGPTDIALKLPPGEHSGSWFDVVTGNKKMWAGSIIRVGRRY